MSNQSDLEVKLDEQLRGAGNTIPQGYQRQYKFCPVRRWAADFSWTERHLVVEVDGGTFIGGRHNTGVGMHNDIVRSNWLQIHGWTLLRGDTTMVKDGSLLAVVMEFFSDAPVLTPIT